MSARLTGCALLLAAAFLGGQANAITQPPHAAADGIECVACHIPYGAAAKTTGTVSTGTTVLKLVDLNKSWTDDQWAGGVVVVVPTSGAASEYSMVVSNDQTSVTLSSPLRTLPAVDDSYELTRVTYDDIETKCRTCHDGTPSMPDVRMHVVNGGATVIGCGKCHEPHNVEANTGVGNGLLRLQIRWPTATQPLHYDASEGAGRLVNLNPPYNGICQICHTGGHYPNNAPPADHHRTELCTACHQHQDRFVHGAGGTGCASCHGHDADYVGPGSPAAGTFQSHSTHTESDSDDVKGPNVGCGTCHNINAFPEPVSGGTWAASTVCNTCHSPGGDYDGVTGSSNDGVASPGAKALWDDGAYTDTSGTALRSEAGRWCASCHDNDLTTPSMNGPAAAPNVTGDEQAANNWNNVGFGFYKTGHGVASSATLPWTAQDGSPYQRRGAGATCLYCHDPTLPHLDGKARTYADVATPHTPLGYQASYRLKSVGGSVPLVIPRPASTPDVKASDFAMCLNGSCHASSAPFDDGNDFQTNFRDGTNNRHNFHLGQSYLNLFRSDWRVGSPGDSRATCVQCHNVHGTEQPSMIPSAYNSTARSGLPRSLSFAYGQGGGADPALTLPGSTTGAYYVDELRVTNPTSVCSYYCHGTGSGWTEYARNPFPPTIRSAFGAIGSDKVTVFFSDGVFGSAPPSADALTLGSFTLYDAGGLTISGVDHVAGNNFAVVTLSGNLIAFGASIGAATSTSIYDSLGNAADPTATVLFGTDAGAPVLTSYTPDEYTVARRATTESDINGAPAPLLLQFSISDSETGVSLSTLSVHIVGETGSYDETYAYPSSQLSVAGDLWGYTVTVTPALALPANKLMTVTVDVDDLSGNAMTGPNNAWSFTTENSVLRQLLLVTEPHTTTGTWTLNGSSWPAALASDDALYVAAASGAGTAFEVNLQSGTPFVGDLNSIRVTSKVYQSAASAINFTLAVKDGASTIATQTMTPSPAFGPGQTKTIQTAWIPVSGINAAGVATMTATWLRSGTGAINRVNWFYVEIESN